MDDCARRACGMLRRAIYSSFSRNAHNRNAVLNGAPPQPFKA